MLRGSSWAVTAACALAIAAGAAAQPYWAVEDGAVLTYSHGVTSVARAGDAVSHRTETVGYVSGRRYLLGADGDVSLADESGEFGSLYESTAYTPPLLLLDLPLETGKTWTSTAERFGSDRQAYTVTVSGLVQEPTTVILPGLPGGAPVLAVRLAFTHAAAAGSPVPEDRIETWLLHAQLGRVDGLQSWSGIVPAARRSWGGVRALFR